MSKLSQAVANVLVKYAVEKSAKPKAKVLGNKKANYLKVDKTVKRVVNLYQKGGDVDVPELLEAVNNAIPAVNKMIDFMEEAKEQGYSTPVYNKLTSSGYKVEREVNSGNGEKNKQLVGSGYLAREGFKDFRMTKFSVVDKDDSLDYELLRQDLLEAVKHITEIAYSGEINATQIKKKQKIEDETLLKSLRHQTLVEVAPDADKYDWNKTLYAIQHNRKWVNTFWDAVHAFEDTHEDYSSDTAISVIFELTFRSYNIYTESNNDKLYGNLKRDIMTGIGNQRIAKKARNEKVVGWEMDYETIANLADLYYNEVKTFVEGRRYL